jgi:hypothetical protein
MIRPLDVMRRIWLFSAGLGLVTLAMGCGDSRVVGKHDASVDGGGEVRSAGGASGTGGNRGTGGSLAGQGGAPGTGGNRGTGGSLAGQGGAQGTGGNGAGGMTGVGGLTGAGGTAVVDGGAVTGADASAVDLAAAGNPDLSSPASEGGAEVQTQDDVPQLASPDTRGADRAPTPDVAIDELPAADVGDTCNAGVTVAYAGSGLPPDIAGHYLEAFDCASEEGGASFGGVDHSHCFRKADGSSWRIWNTGCGWEYGRPEPDSYDANVTKTWVRYARTYSGQCAAIPAAQLTTAALTTTTFFDRTGGPILGLASRACGFILLVDGSTD